MNKIGLRRHSAKVIRWIAAIILIVTGCFASLAQPYLVHIEHAGLDEGLSHRKVNFIYKDENGFIWAATSLGLNKFDGYSFQVFDKSSNGLSTNEIDYILGDKKGKLWLISGHIKLVKTIDIFDPISEEVLTFEEYFGDSAPFSPSEIIQFHFTADGKMVFLLNDGKIVFYDDKFRLTKGRLTEYGHFYHTVYSRDSLIWFIYVNSRTSELQIKVFNEEGAFQFEVNPPENTEYAQLIQPNSIAEPYRFLLNFGEEGYGIYQVSNTGNLSFDSTYYNQFVDLPIQFNTYTDMSHIKENNGIYWLKDETKFILFDPANDWILDLTEINPSFNFSSHIIFESTNRIWLGSQFGLLFVEIQKNKFETFLTKKDSLHAFRDLVIDANNRMWGITNFPLNVYTKDLSKGSIKEGWKKLSDLSPAIDEIISSEDLFYVMHELAPGITCFATRSKLHCVDGEDFTVKTYNLRDNNQYNPHIWALYEDNEGLIWYGDQAGRIGYNAEDSSSFIDLEEGRSNVFYIYQFHKASDGQIWLATQQGLYTVDLLKKQVTGRFFNNDDQFAELPSHSVYHIHEDKDGSFWLATAGSGLIHWMPGSNTFRQYSTKEGLSSNILYAVYEDGNNHLWLPSDNGLSKFNKEDGTSITYLEDDGISHHEFNRLSHTRHSDGRLFFGSLNGVTTFHPEEFQDEASLSTKPLRITKFQKFNKTENGFVDLTSEIKTSGKIVLTQKDMFFRLDFALLDYNRVDQIRYAYIIEGINDEWNYQTENFIQLNKLPYGCYTLKIKGEDHKGIESLDQLVLTLEIPKPFYATNWFIILMILLLGIIVISIIRIRTKSLLAQQKQLEKEVQKRTKRILEDKVTIENQAEELKSLEAIKSRFFANVSHELRTPLTLILGPIQSILERAKIDTVDMGLLQLVKNNGERLTKLVNEILDISKLESGKMEVNEEKVMFRQFLDSQVSPFKSSEIFENINFFIEYNLPDDLILVMDKGKLSKILQNYFSNALKFTKPGGSIFFYVRAKDKNVILSVRDEGPGIHPKDLPHVFDRFYQSKQGDLKFQEGTGIGLALCKELAELMGGKVWVESIFGAGSTFHCQIPKKTTDPEVPDEEFIETKDGNLSGITTLKTNDGKNIKEDVLSTAPKVKILLVEDNQELQQFLKYLLSDFELTMADNGQQALKKISSFTPDLIISDVMMPIMDGIEFLSKIKATDRWRHIPFILLTAKKNLESKIEALRIGVDDYLTKPFQEEELKARINNLLQNYRQRLQFEESEFGRGPSIEVPLIGEADSEWLKEVESQFTAFLSDTTFNIATIAHELHISERHLRRKLKQLIGLSPNEYLKEIRLQEARLFLERGTFKSIKELSYAVGFKDSKYFSKVFRERFGSNPSDHIN